MTIQERLTAVQTAVTNGDYPHAFDHATRLAGELKDLAREVTPVLRNYVGVEDGELRKEVEPPYTFLMDTLKMARRDWKLGKSHPWAHGANGKVYDLLTDAEANDVYGAINHAMEVALDKADKLRPLAERRRVDRTIGHDGRTKREFSEEWLTAAAQRGVTIDVTTIVKPRTGR